MTMERLTARHKNGNREAYYPYCFRPDTCDGDGTSEKCDRCHFEKAVCERLANYEDIGLTPEHIRELKKRNILKPARPISEKSLYATCLNCRRIIFRGHRFCPDCGQRLRGEE